MLVDAWLTAEEIAARYRSLSAHGPERVRKTPWVPVARQHRNREQHERGRQSCVPGVPPFSPLPATIGSSHMAIHPALYLAAGRSLGGSVTTGRPSLPFRDRASSAIARMS